MRRIIQTIVDASASKKKQAAVLASINTEKANLDDLIAREKEVSQKIEQLKKNRDKVFGEVENAEKVLQEIKEKRNKREQDLAKVSGDYQSVRDRLLGAQGAYKSLSNDVKILERTIIEKQQEADRKVVDVLSSTREDLRMAKIEYSALEAGKNDLEKKVAEQARLVDELKEKRLERMKKIAQLEKDIKASENLLASKNLANLKASEKIRGLHDEINRLNNDAEKNKNDIAKLAESKKKAEDELEKIKNITLAFVRREVRLKALIPELKELYSRAGIEIDL